MDLRVLHFQPALEHDDVLEVSTRTVWCCRVLVSFDGLCEECSKADTEFGLNLATELLMRVIGV